jgi:hypothetical protein
VADTLSSGPEPRLPGRGRPRWLVPLAGVVAVAVLAVLAVRDGTGRDPEPPVAVETSTPPRPPLSTRHAPEAVFRLDGEPGAGPAVRLLVSGVQAGVLDARTGRLTPLPALRAARNTVVELRRGPGFTTATVYDRTDRTEGAQSLLLPDGGGSVELGRQQSVLPMRDGTVLTRVCLTRTGRGCVLSSRTATGTVRWQRRVRSSAYLIRDTPYGLLALGWDRGDGGTLRLVDPRTGQVRREVGRTDRVLAADDRRVVYERPGCDYGCPILVADLADGSRTEVPVRPGRPRSAAISPDGRRLAVGLLGLSSRDPVPSPERDGHAMVLDLRTMSWEPVPGLTTGVGAVPVPVWTPDGSQLLLATPGSDGVSRMAAWRPGDHRLTVLPVQLRDFAVQPGSIELLT